MKISDISYYLFESYKDARAKFSQEESEDIVKQYLDTFKQLAKKGKASGQEKDIGYWIKQGWPEFKSFVDSKSQEKTKSEVKKAKKKDSIIAHEDDDTLVVIPLSKSASCYYGKETKWCTSSNHENLFYQYIFILEMFLVYIIKKDTNEKYAAVVPLDSKRKNIRVYDDSDVNIPGTEKIEKVLNIPIDTIRSWVEPHKEFLNQYFDINNLSDDIQKDLIYDEDKMGFTMSYPKMIKKINNPSEDVQLYAIEKNPLYIAHIDNPTDRVINKSIEGNENSIKMIKSPEEKHWNYHHKIWTRESEDEKFDTPLSPEEWDELDKMFDK